MESELFKSSLDTEIKDGEYIKTDTPEFNWVWSPQGLIYMHMPHFGVWFSFLKTLLERLKFSLKRVT